MSENIKEMFAKNLRYQLDKHGKKQADLAKYMNVSTGTASEWCTGKKMPRANKIQAICNWLIIELEDLLTDKPQPNDEDDSIRLPGYFKQYIFDEDTAYFALQVKKRPILKDLLGKADALNDSEIRIIMSLADKFVEERNNNGGAKTL